MPSGDPLTYAVQAEKNLEALATELASMGADKATVNAISQMAETCRQIVQALGKGQAETGDAQPAYREPEPQPTTIAGATEQLHGDMQASAASR